jgi:PKD repeat protein
MVKFKFYGLFCACTLMSCEMNNLYWNLPRSNRLDSLQNQNPLGANYPVAKFLASNNEINLGGSVDFVSTSLNNPENHTWTFVEGIPNFSTEASQSVRYDRIGKYDVVLKVQNQYGSDSVVARNYINAMYIKDFSNQMWDGWVSDGWVFRSTQVCPGCIQAGGWGSMQAEFFSLSKDFTDIPSGSKLIMYYQVYDCRLTLKVNNVAIWTSDTWIPGEDVTIELPPISNPQITFELSASHISYVRLNNIRIKL